jgi:hypothetical protein
VAVTAVTVGARELRIGAFELERGKSVAENGVCERRSAAGLKSRSFNGHLSARLNRLLKNAFMGREIEQGLKAQRNVQLSRSG